MECDKYARLAIEKAGELGAYAVEAYVIDSRELTAEVANKQVETLKVAEATGIGVRVFTQNGAMGFGYMAGFDTARISTIAQVALDNTRQTYADSYRRLPEMSKEIPQMNLLDKGLSATVVEDKINIAREVEAAALQADKRVTRTEKCVYVDVQYELAIANSKGGTASYKTGYCGIYALVLAEADKDVQSGLSMSYSRQISGLDPLAVGREAAKNAGLLLNAKSIGTTKTSIVFSPYMATNLFSVLIPAFSADAVQKGRSLLKNKMNTRIVSPLLTFIDDGRLKGGISESPCDDEGVLTGKTELIVEGILRNYLYDTYTAAKDKVKSTGNSVRSSFSSIPDIGPHNIYIKPGDISPEKLIAELKDGFYITDIMGMHTANPISGDFSVGASGVWIRNGEFSQAVRGVAIAGNILELLSGIDAVGSDLRFFGAKGSPTIRVSGITVSGA